MNLQVELTSRCQLSCVECPHRLMTRKKQDMSDEVADVVLEYIKNLENREKELGYPPTIILHKDGEPLLYPKLKSFIGRAALSRPEFRINLYTNGLLLTEEFIQFLSRLPNRVWLFVSFHFFNADGRETDYSKIFKLLGETIEKDYRNLDLAFTSHVTRFCSEERLSEWENSWMKYLGKGKWSATMNKHINPWTDLIHEDNCVTFDACPYGDFGHLFIGVTGNVIPCCMDLEEELIIGNIMEQSSEEIYKKADEFYTKIRAKEDLSDVCKRCMK